MNADMTKNDGELVVNVSGRLDAITSKEFEKVLERVNQNPTLFKFNQDSGKLRTVTRGVDSLDKALQILKKLQ